VRKKILAKFVVSAQIRSAHLPNTRQKLHLEPNCSVFYEISLPVSDAVDDSRLRRYYGISTFIVDCLVTSFRTKWSVVSVAPTSDVRALTIFLLRSEEITSYDVGTVFSEIILTYLLHEAESILRS